MRATILTLIGISLATAVAFLALRSPAPPVALAFTGYDTNGWLTFGLTNHTRFPISHSHPHIEVHTNGVWTDYYGIETSMIRHMGPLRSHQSTTLSASLPEGRQRWRATVHYCVDPVDYPPMRARFESVLDAIRLGRSTNEVTLITQEFLR